MKPNQLVFKVFKNNVYAVIEDGKGNEIAVSKLSKEKIEVIYERLNEVEIIYSK